MRRFPPRQGRAATRSAPSGAVVVIFGHDGPLADANYVRLEKLGLLPGFPQFQAALGTALAAGKFDGDTLDGHACADLAIGAEFEGKFEGPGPGPLTEAGGVYVVRGGDGWVAARDAGEQLSAGACASSSSRAPSRRRPIPLASTRRRRSTSRIARACRPLASWPELA